MVADAIILMAGAGLRLRPHNQGQPKALIEVGGRTLVARALDILGNAGIRTASLVVGYGSDRVRECVGDSVSNVHVQYIENSDFSSTNTMYSLWLAREILESGALILEGDYIFEEEVVHRLLDCDHVRSWWAGTEFRPGMDGSCLECGGDGRVERIRIVHEPLKDYTRSYKSLGLLKITPAFGARLASALNEYVERRKVSLYYDEVVGMELLSEPLHICDVNALDWIEIDTVSDLREARRLFS